jgi:hypothetical protein
MEGAVSEQVFQLSAVPMRVIVRTGGLSDWLGKRSHRSAGGLLVSPKYIFHESS